MMEKQEEPEEDLRGEPLVEVNLRLVTDPADEIFGTVTDKPPVWLLECSFRGVRFTGTNTHKIEGVTRQVLGYFARELKSGLPFLATSWTVDEAGNYTAYTWRNGASGLIRRQTGVFYVY